MNSSSWDSLPKETVYAIGDNDKGGFIRKIYICRKSDNDLLNDMYYTQNVHTLR